MMQARARQLADAIVRQSFALARLRFCSLAIDSELDQLHTHAAVCDSAQISGLQSALLPCANIRVATTTIEVSQFKQTSLARHALVQSIEPWVGCKSPIKRRVAP